MVCVYSKKFDWKKFARVCKKNDFSKDQIKAFFLLQTNEPVAINHKGYRDLIRQGIYISDLLCENAPPKTPEKSVTIYNYVSPPILQRQQRQLQLVTLEQQPISSIPFPDL